MDTKFQTSFIPKKSTTDTSGYGRPENLSIFLIVSIIIFAISLLSATALFFYQRSLVKSIKELDDQLVKYQNSFDPKLLDTLGLLDKRLESSRLVLDNHTAVSPIFDLLENETLATVKFTSFDFDSKEKSSAIITLSGLGKNFTSVALQSDIFGQERSLKNPVFSELNPDQVGNIGFKFTAGVDTALLSYKGLVAPEIKK